MGRSDDDAIIIPVDYIVQVEELERNNKDVKAEMENTAGEIGENTYMCTMRKRSPRLALVKVSGWEPFLGTYEIYLTR